MRRTSRRRPWLAVAVALFGVGWGANQFVSLLIAYHHHLGLSTRTNQALFGIYALGLVPALLLGGPASDRFGRSRIVRPAVALSLIASAVLMLGSRTTPALYAGRFLAGIVSGAAFAAGTAWVKELSVPPFDPTGGELHGARRAAVALSAGFGLGPVATGLIAQWSPDPLVLAYLPHLLIVAIAFLALLRVPETVTSRSDVRLGWSAFAIPGDGDPRFRTVVLPLAPWVFAGPAVAFAVLPTITSARTVGYGIVFAGCTAGLTLAVGVGVQPLARRFDANGEIRGAVAGLGSAIVGLLLAALAAHTSSPPAVLLAAAVLGAGYGFCLVFGLLEVQRIASPTDLAALTALYYALTYVGFAVPIILAELTGFADYTELLLGLAGVATLCLGLVAFGARRLSAR